MGQKIVEEIELGGEKMEMKLEFKMAMAGSGLEVIVEEPAVPVPATNRD